MLHLLLRNLLIISLLSIYAWTATGQVAQVESLTVEDGLSQGMIFDIEKDQDGFMWFATKNGLNRYDGYEFKIFTHNPFDTTTIRGNIINDLLEDSQKRFWVGGQGGGLHLYDKLKEQFIHISATQEQDIKNLLEDKDGNIWYSAEAKLYQLKIKTDKNGRFIGTNLLLKADMNKANDEENTISLKYTSDKKLLIGTRLDGLFRWDFKRNQLVKSNIGENILNIKYIEEFPKGVLWVGVSNQILRIEQKKVVHAYSTASIFNDNRKRIFKIAPNPVTGNLLIHYSFHPIVYEIDLSKPIESATLTPSFELDKKTYPTQLLFEGKRNLWIGTNGYGVRKVALQKYSYKHLAQGFSMRQMWVIPNGDLCFQNHRNLLYLKNGTTTPIFINDLIAGLGEREGRSLLSAKNGGYWLLTEDKSIIGKQIVKLNKDFQIERTYPEEDINPIFGFFLEDNNGDLWFPFKESSFKKLDTKTGEFVKINAKKTIESTINWKIYNSLYKDKEGHFWISSLHGLYKVTIARNSFDVVIYQNDPKNIKSINNNDVAVVLEDSFEPNKTLWVGTKGGGLNKLNKITGEFEHFTTKDGLIDNTVYGILPDANNNLWLSTNRGISKFNKKTKQFTNFTKADGLQDDEFNTASYYRDERTGKLYFGGINGITAFFPNEIKLSDYKPELYLTELKIHNEIVNVGKSLQESGKNPLSKPIEFTDKIKLAWHQNQVSIQFAALDYTVPDNILYQYKMSGVNKKWINADKNRIANYSNLSSGNYTFEVRCSNSSGVWNEEILTLEIIIYPPWWQTTWAYLLYILIIGAISWYVYQFQINRITLEKELAFEQKEALRLAEMDKIKTNFFSNITHEFRTPLTLIVEPLRQIIKNPKQNWLPKAKLAKVNSERLLNLINQLLDLSKLESNKMTLELKRGQIIEVIQPIIQSFQLLANRKNIELTYTAPKAIDYFDFDKDKIEKILYNLISNAIKFTKSHGTITINILEKSESQQMQLEVIDTGIGISADAQPHIFDRFYQVDGSHTRVQEGTGIGLALSKELAEVMNGSLTFKSDANKGSIFKLLIPMVQTSMIMTPTTQSQHRSTSNLIEHNSLLMTPNEQAATNNAQPNIHLDATNVALIVEDNYELRAFIKSSIEQHYQVIEAPNGYAGLALASKYLPNIIVSDVMMPLVDGFEMCENIKTSEQTAHIPVILLTAKTAMDSRLQGLKYGADAYMSKPFSTEELLVRMSNLIEVRRQLQQKYGQVIEKIVEKNIELPHIAPQENQMIDDSLSTFDQAFLNNLYKIVQEHLDDENFSVELLIKKTGTSKTQLHRKMRALLNQSPSQFIRNIRLKTAYELLQQGKGNVTEIAFMVGFSNSKYFSTKFKEKYGVSPSKI